MLAGCGDRAKLGWVELAVRAGRPRVPAVDVAEADALLAGGAVWVDVRTPEERAVSRIPGAIDAEVVLAQPDAYAGRVLIAYCTIGVRSAAWAADRRREGLDARNLSGSVVAWARAGRSFEGPAGPTRRVHTWSERYDWLPEGYEAVP